MVDLSRITESEIRKYTLETTLDVYEKVDMIYFKVYVTDSCVFVRNAKGRIVDDVDVIVNSVYGDIMEFAQGIDADALYGQFGPMHIGFFYLPIPTTKSITYGNMEPGTFIVSEYYADDKKRRDDSAFLSIMEDIPSLIVGWNGHIGPYIGSVSLSPHFDYDNVNEHRVEFVRDIFESLGVECGVTGNEIDEIEGIVLRDGKTAYSVTVNDTKPAIEASTKLIYRDMFLKSVAHAFSDDDLNAIFTSGKDYVGKVCDLFLSYVDSTNFFKTNFIEEDDFLPPFEGYLGDLVYDRLSPIVQMVCKRNPVYKNALRILLITFKPSSYEGKFDRFEENDRNILSEMLFRFKNNA